MFDSQQGQEIRLSFREYRVVVEPTQRSMPVAPGTLSPGLKRPGCEAAFSTPSSARIMKKLRSAPTQPCVLIPCTGSVIFMGTQRAPTKRYI